MNEFATTASAVDSVAKDLVPAEDRVSESLLLERLAEKGLERVLDADSVEVFKESYRKDGRFGERWSMQKAMCLLWTDFAGEGGVTLLEVAFLIDTWFERPNYGAKRAQIDLKKFIGRKFACQNLSGSSEVAA